MSTVHIKAKNLHEAQEAAMKELNISPIIARENQNTMDYTKEMSILVDVEDVSKPTMTMAIPGDLEAVVKYVLELRDGIRDFELNYVDENSSKWSYTYHELFAPYLPLCIEELKRNHATRRAVLPIAGEKSYGEIDPPCMQLINFIIVNDKLNTTAMFRSNDGVDAFALNSFGIIELARKVANEVDVELGSYTHYATNFHAYSKCFDKLENYCRLFDKHNNKFWVYDDYLEAYDDYAEDYINECNKRHKMLELKKTHKL